MFVSIYGIKSASGLQRDKGRGNVNEILSSSCGRQRRTQSGAGPDVAILTVHGRRESRTDNTTLAVNGMCRGRTVLSYAFIALTKSVRMSRSSCGRGLQNQTSFINQPRDNAKALEVEPPVIPYTQRSQISYTVSYDDYLNG